jgi:integrase
MRKTLSDRGVAALKPRAQRYAFPDPELTGHWVRVYPTGVKSFCAVTRDPRGKQIWTKLGNADVLSIAEAREQARTVIKRVHAGLAAIEPPADAFGAVAGQWLKRHGEAKGLRSLTQIKRLLNVHVMPAWGERPFVGIRRSDVAALLDGIEDKHGARQADLVLTIVRSIMNWHATRHDNYNPPIVRGMRRQNPKDTERERVLTDDELRVIWKAAEASGTFGAIIRMLLLTAQRRTKVANMKWSELSDDLYAWTVPQETREKGTGAALVLPDLAHTIIATQPRFEGNEHVFAGRGGGGFSGFSASKITFDAKLPSITERWTLHDLRRTARSLMSRAGVLPKIAERVLGHATGGVEGIYDRHRYDAEKADALRKLAALIDGVVHPRANVTVMERPSKRR